MFHYHIKRGKKGLIRYLVNSKEERKEKNIKQMGNRKQIVVINPAISVKKLNIIRPNTSFERIGGHTKLKTKPPNEKFSIEGHKSHLECG